MKLKSCKFDNHHLYGRTQYPILRFVDENGVILLRQVHKEYHSSVGGFSGLNVDISVKSFLSFLHTLSENLPYLRKFLLQMFSDCELTSWYNSLESYDITLYKRINVDEINLAKPETIWLEEPDIAKLIYILQRRIELCIDLVLARGEILTNYLSNPQLIPSEFQNSFLEEN